MFILGIESSCDETSASIIQCDNSGLKIVSNIVASQIKIHQPNQGVIPELAAREHVKNILPVLKKAIKSIRLSDIEAIAVTRGPGLFGSLLIGVETAKILAYTLQKPLLAINHLEGHIYANFLDHNQLQFPIICLIVSGGHTQIVLIKKHLHYKILGETLDDAAGEAFDKVGRILGLPYPGGPAIESLVNKTSNVKYNLKIKLPRPMLHSKDYNFSFSGLKTAVLYLVRDLEKKYALKFLRPVIAREFQDAVIEVLVKKTIQASQEYKAKTVCMGGGVSASTKLNQQLREQLKNYPSVTYISPIKSMSTDNAAMIAVAGYFHYLDKRFVDWKEIFADANLSL